MTNENLLKMVKGVYSELMECYNSGEKDIKKYIAKLEKYEIKLKSFSKSGKNSYDYLLAFNGGAYSLYTSLNNIYSCEYVRLVEDLTKCVYTLYDGEGYNTSSLIEYINKL